MKVMRIDDRLCINSLVPNIPIGEIVTVKGQCPVYPDCWDIVEYPVDKLGRACSYRKDAFAPLSDIDELELIEQRLCTA